MAENDSRSPFQGKKVSVTLTPTCEEYVGLLDLDMPEYVELILVHDGRNPPANGGVRHDRVRIYTSNIRHIREMH